MAKHDVAALRRGIDLADLIERYGYQLAKAGAELEACCPFHSEKTPSFRVFEKQGRQAFYCFGCGANGDHIDFVMEHDGVSFREACDRIAEMIGGSYQPANDNAATRRTSNREERRDPWQHGTAPRPDEPAPPKLRVRRGDEWISQPVVAAWPYHTAAGELVGYACRIEFTKDDGSTGKDVIPVSWMVNTDTGEARWKQRAFAAPRPLYRAHELAENQDAQVLLVEGEKTADAARRLLDGSGIIVTTWAGGSKAIGKADWSALAGRKVVCWPDCDSKRDQRTGAWRAYQDQPGMWAMLGLAKTVEESGGQARIVAVPYPGELEDGWDLADAEAEGWDQERVLTFIREHLFTRQQISEMPAHAPGQEPEPEPETANDNAPPPLDGPPLDAYDDMPPADDCESVNDRSPNDEPAGEPFRILGWDRGTAFYLPDGFRQVVALRATEHKALNLMQIAPLSYWQSTFPSEKRSGDKVDWPLAAESLIRRAQRAGLWDSDLIRGRGAWWDSGKAAVHLGDRVVIDGQAYSLREAPTEYVYEMGKPMRIATAGPLPNADAHRFVEICESIRWEKPIYGKLLAGWVFLAPICGALEWRPHIWITGGAGTGKSTVMTHIISRALDRTMLFVQGDTTEAGIRRSLGRDAVPVVFDEFEPATRKGQERVSTVMELVTIASSETGAKLLKAGAGGGVDSFLIRSMFAFSSIAVNLEQYAAKTRVTVLSLQPNQVETEETKAQYVALMDNIIHTLTPEYIDRMQARAVALIPVIRHNARVFAEAAAVTLGSRRFGDQIGTLIAGAYALHSTGKVTEEAARRWIEAQDWDDQTETAEAKDERACIQHILASQVRVETAGVARTRTVGELIERATYTGEAGADEAITREEAVGALKRSGLCVDDSDPLSPPILCVANSHLGLAKITAGTPWATCWPRTLLRLPGAKKGDPRKFAGATSRCVMIPMSALE